MMKTLSLLILSLIAGAALAQPINNYLSDADTRTPDGVSGPGIVHTQHVQGRVIGVGNPIMKSFATGKTCTPIQQQPRYQPQQQNDSSINPGTILGAIAGGIVGNQVGGGDGNKAAIAIGAVTGAMVGNNMHQQSAPQRYEQPQQELHCETFFEQRIVGYPFVVEYNRLQMQGVMNRQPQIGESVQVIVRSTYYPGF
jgi:uncharacterized protein YcfJ